MKRVCWLAMVIFWVAKAMAGDVILRVVNPCQDPVPDFKFTTQSPNLHDVGDVRNWQTSEAGECPLTSLTPGGIYLVKWQQQGLVAQGQQMVVCRAGLPVTMTVRVLDRSQISVVQIVGPDGKPAQGFSFTTRPAVARDYRESRVWETDERGECQLCGMIGAHILAWEQQGQIEGGGQNVFFRMGETVTVRLRAQVAASESGVGARSRAARPPGSVAGQAVPRGSVGLAAETRCGSLSSFCLDREDHFLLCNQNQKRLRVVSTDDKLLKDYRLDFRPQVVACREDGVIVVAGDKKIVLLNAQGEQLCAAALPGEATDATAAGASSQDVFVCVRAKTGFTIYRFTSKLSDPTPVIKGLRGCCGQMDFAVRNNYLYLANNCKFLVEKYDRNGQRQSSFGSRFGKSREDATAQSFNGCCEPKNVCFDVQGNIYTAESHECSVKKFSEQGDYIGFIGTGSFIHGCVRVTIACTRDGHVYILDTSHNIILPVTGTSSGRS